VVTKITKGIRLSGVMFHRLLQGLMLVTELHTES